MSSRNIYQEVNTLAQHKGFKILSSEIHLHTAAVHMTPVLAFIGAELMGSGIIEELTDECVKISGEYYPRETCTFTYSK